MLVGNMPDQVIDDFQDIDAWRQLVPVVAAAVREQTGHDLVIVQTVTRRDYWLELVRAMAENNCDVTHVCLDCADAELGKRIELDTVEAGAREWRIRHVKAFLAARSWLTAYADLVLDTTYLTADEAARRILLFVA